MERGKKKIIGETWKRDTLDDDTAFPEKFPPARVYIIFLILRKERRKEQAAKARQILAAAREEERNMMKKVDGKLPEILTGRDKLRPRRKIKTWIQLQSEATGLLLNVTNW